MIVRVFTNQTSYPNVVMIQCGSGNEYSNEIHGTVVKIKNEKGETCGFNLLNSTIYFSEDGYHKMTQELLSKVNEHLLKEGIEAIEHDFTSYIKIGFIERCEKHPDSDHLHVCQVNVGEQTLQIVCGAHNVAIHQKVVVATENAVMPSGLMIKNGSLRGVKSYGMLCSAYELGIEKEPKKGILLLEENALIGATFQ